MELAKATMSGGFLGWAFGVMFMGYGLAFWYGPKEIIRGNMTVSDVMITFFSVLMGALSVGQAGPIFGLISSVAGSYTFIKAIIERVPPIDTRSQEGAKPDRVHGAISFKNINFFYPTRPGVQVRN